MGRSPICVVWVLGGAGGSAAGREGSELRDGNDLGEASCAELGLGDGLLACDGSCTIDTSMCDATQTGADVTGATDVVPVGLGVLALVAVRRRRRTARASALAAALMGLVAQACSDPTVRTETEASNEDSSMTGESGSENGATETTGEPLPQWALGIFSSEADRVGMSFSDNPYWWGKIEITASGAFLLDWYACSGLGEHQEFRWTLADDGRSLSVHPVPPADVFTYGNGNRVSEVIVEPGDSCDTVVVRFFLIEAMIWGVDEYHRGDVCARATGPDGCTFTFEWCDGMPPPPCE